MIILNVFLGISILFFLLLALKQVLPKKSRKNFCVICGSVSITWAVLLVLYWLNYFDDKIILAILLGQSITGIFYFLKSKLSKEKNIFALPFILTLTMIAYVLISSLKNFNTIIFLVILWLIFSLFYIYKRSKKFNFFIKKLIECCRNW